MKDAPFEERQGSSAHMWNGGDWTFERQSNGKLKVTISNYVVNPLWLGIFTALLGALVLTLCFDSINFFVTDAASIGIIGGADGPTAIWLTTKLSPDLLGSIAVAAYSYMALVPVIQPPIMKALTTQKERQPPKSSSSMG